MSCCNDSVAFLITASSAEAQQRNVAGRGLSPEDVRRKFAPALEKYTRDRLDDEVWNRPGLTPRDRSLVTIAALIARELTLPMPYYFGQALDTGVKPARSPGSSRTWPSTRASAMPSLPWARRGMFLLSAGSVPIRFRRRRLRFSH